MKNCSELEIKDLIKDNNDCFFIDNKKVWMNKKPDFLEKMSKEFGKNDQKCIVSLFLPNEGRWMVDLGSKKAKYNTVILMATKDIMDKNKKCRLKAMSPKIFIPSNIIYNFNAKGYMFMFDYVKKDYISERQEKEEAMKALMN